MDKSYNFEEYLNLEIDYLNIINSSLDAEKGSILCIDHQDSKKLDSFIQEALDKDVNKVLTSKNSNIINKKVYKFEDYPKVFEDILKKIYPSFKDKNYFGITGTNGKTTTGHYLNILLGESSVFVGTIEHDNLFSFTKEKHLTTPKLFNLIKMLSKINEEIENVVLEVSSHALSQKRLKGLSFKMSGFTNLSQDHLDYHGNMEEYFLAKTELFSENISEQFCFVSSTYGNRLNKVFDNRGISVDGDSQIGVKLISNVNNRITFSIEENNDIENENKPHLLVESDINISGPESINNFLLAFSMAYFSKVRDLDVLKGNIPRLYNPKGRYEVINYHMGEVIVDYSHTPEAIEKVINYTKERFKKNVIVILGAGGNRDKSKRIHMGKASQSAEKIIITNDNPRNEDELQIAKQILEGIDLKKNVEIILDRKEAISKGINLLDGESTLLILGKGHEEYQEINGKFHKFNDAKIVEQIIGNT